MLPPARFEVGTGFRKVDGEAQTATPPPRVTADANPTTDHPIVVTAGIHPLGFGRQLLERHFDVGVGYVYQGGPRAKIHGAYLEGEGILGQWSAGADSVLRTGVRTQLRILGEEDVSLLGRGATVGGFVEIAKFGEGDFAGFDKDGGVVGVATGEGGVGLAIDAGYAQIDRATVTSLTASLTVRIPIVAGFAFTWLWNAKK